ncbi:MAG: di-heme oxidoredictase family protein [Pseudomonadota bacterium]
MTGRIGIVGSVMIVGMMQSISGALAGDYAAGQELGSERAIEQHLADGKEFSLRTQELVEHGRRLFEAKWTGQDGGGRPLTTGTGSELADSSSPLVFPRNFNRISGPDANSCAGCHNQPRVGGAGDQVANVFVLGQRFDFASFDASDPVARRGGRDELGKAVTLASIANERNTVGMFGAGFVEMLARQISARLRRLRDALAPGESVALRAKGIDFGTLSRHADGRWNTSGISALPPTSLESAGPDEPPSLVVRPFHQAGAVVSLREFSNNAFNHHHGIQSTERFGMGDPDGDGEPFELTRADMTAVSVYQATLAVPGRVIPRNPAIEAAVRKGETTFASIGCADCHVPKLKLRRKGWFYSEPNPYNPPGNLLPGDAPELAVNLLSPRLDQPRLRPHGNVVEVPAYTDFRLHNISTGPDDPNCEPLNMHFTPGSNAFFAGNCRFLTSRLWGVASSSPYFHHGKYTTLREAIEAHRGDANYAYRNWLGISARERDAVIEFLKTLKVLPPGTRHRIVDERYRPRSWPTE